MIPRPLPGVLQDLPPFETLQAQAAEFPELDATAIQACLVLLYTSSKLSSAFETHFTRHGLSKGRFTVLMLLRRYPQGLSPAELADKAGVTRPTMTGVLDTLEKGGLVHREANPSDGRAVVVTLTPQGRSLLKRYLPTHYQVTASMMAQLDQKERKDLVRLLTKVSESIQQRGTQ